MSELSPNVRAIARKNVTAILSALASVGQSTLAKHCGLSEPRFPAAVLIISAAGFLD